MKRKVFLPLILIVFMVGILGCAATMKGKLVQTQNTLAAMIRTYNIEMDLQTNEAVKEEWRNTFMPLFERADKALIAYETAIQNGMDVNAKRDLFMFIKSQILLEFLRANIEFSE